MSFLPGGDVQTALVPLFQGSMNGQDSYNIDPGHGLYSQNVDFILGPGNSTSGSNSVQVATRRGTAQVAQNPNATDGVITSIANWFFFGVGTPNCFVAMYSPVNGVRFFNQSGPTFTEIVIAVTGAAGAAFVPNGTRIYACFFDATGRNGVSSAYVYGLFEGAYLPGEEAVDALFSPPLTTSVATVTPTQPTTGVITAGMHNLGYVFITRNGDGAQVLNPVSIRGVFSPVSFIAIDGVHNLQVVISFASIPSYLNPAFAPTLPTVQLVMTSAANPAEYYLIPGAIGDVPTSPGSVTITCSITDGDLVTGTNVTQNQNLLTSATGGGPILPSAIFTYSSRLAYVTRDAANFPVVYFSDQNNYQSLTAAFHLEFTSRERRSRSMVAALAFAISHRSRRFTRPSDVRRPSGHMDATAAHRRIGRNPFTDMHARERRPAASGIGEGVVYLSRGCVSRHTAELLAGSGLVENQLERADSGADRRRFPG